MKIYKSIEELVGKTPLLELTHIEKENGLKARVLGKLEGFNPAGSVKDRAAMSMLDDAEARGLIKPGAMIIEPTSGNTGIGLAALAAIRGYKAIIIMPDNLSVERVKIFKAYGAEVILTDAAGGMKLSIEKAEELAAEIPNSFIPSQFDNPANTMAHIASTGPEIWEDTDGQVDIFVAGVGTGATLSGNGSFLKSKNPELKVVAVEPETSAILSGEKPGPHGLQGIGAGFIPGNLDVEVIDEVVRVTDEEAYEASRMLARREGVLVGISAGAALHAALKLAEREENTGKNIVVIFPDGADKYLSTDLFEV